MRIDNLLNKLCLFKTRSKAKKACGADLVKVNGKIAKSSTQVIENDIIEYTIYGNYFKFRITGIPHGNIAKTESSEYYHLIKRDKIEIS